MNDDVTIHKTQGISIPMEASGAQGPTTRLIIEGNLEMEGQNVGLRYTAWSRARTEYVAYGG